MKTRKVEIEVPEGKKAIWVNGVLTLVDEKPEDVKERVKTFEDACAELGEEHPLVLQYNSINESLLPREDISEDIIAYLKLRIIAAALNEGWEPQFTTDEWRYFPWFVLYTQEEIDEMSEEDKSRVVLRSSYYAYTIGGVAFVYANNDSSSTYSYSGSRLAFKTRDLAEYAGKQFADIYADFVFKPKQFEIQK